MNATFDDMDIAVVGAMCAILGWASAGSSVSVGHALSVAGTVTAMATLALLIHRRRPKPAALVFWLFAAAGFLASAMLGETPGMDAGLSTLCLIGADAIRRSSTGSHLY